MLDIIIVTLFEQMIDLAIGGVLKRPLASGKLSLRYVNYRQFAQDKHKTVDDRPFGGGSGMLLKPDICYRALEHARQLAFYKPYVIALTPAGVRLEQNIVKNLKEQCWENQTMIVFCGRYEGFDQRFLDTCVDLPLSIGDFILSGAEYPALCLIDALARLIPGTLKAHSLVHESFNQSLLDHPSYTKPINFLGKAVPSVLLSGDHAKIDKWRHQRAHELTLRWRPDLLENPSEIEL